ncbi:MAG: protein kinase [Phycisphaerae bacterium]|nr:protein kinase [Phycisphaerae bacterium]
MTTARLLPFVGAAICMSAYSATAATSEWLGYTFQFSFQESKVSHHPNVVQFHGASLVDFSETPDPTGIIVKNPMFQSKGLQGTNPMHADRGRRTPDSPLEAADFLSITVTFSETTHFLHSPGIVHRDIAARNILLATTKGVYVSDFGMSRLFSSEGPMDYGTVDPKLPIRWSAPEVLPMRLYLNGDANSSDWIDIEAGGTFETVAIPSPAGISLAAFAALTAARRRR